MRWFDREAVSHIWSASGVIFLETKASWSNGWSMTGVGAVKFLNPLNSYLSEALT